MPNLVPGRKSHGRIDFMHETHFHLIRATKGTDFWDLSMVDPDNRRPVDYDARVRALEDAPPSADLIGDARWRDGALKQRLVARVLQCRASDPELCEFGEYPGLALEGRTHQGC